MKYFGILLATILLGFWSSPLYADGRYEIGKDAGGVYFQTDNHGGWYIDREDLKYFKIGETGTYYIKEDRDGTYLTTNNLYKFYLDLESSEKIEREVDDFNRYYEEKMEQEQAEEAKRRAENLKEMEARRRARENSSETYIIITRTRSNYQPESVREQIEDHSSNLRNRLRGGPTRGGSFTPSYISSKFILD